MWVLGCRGWERCESRLFVSYDYLAEQSMVCIGILVEEETMQWDLLLMGILLDVDYQNDSIKGELTSCRIWFLGVGHTSLSW